MALIVLFMVFFMAPLILFAAKGNFEKGNDLINDYFSQNDSTFLGFSFFTGSFYSALCAAVFYSGTETIRFAFGRSYFYSTNANHNYSNSRLMDGSILNSYLEIKRAPATKLTITCTREITLRAF
jgi:hypothetical protein